MLQRCLNPSSARYPDYGGRGITVCDSWRDSFQAFVDDMGEPPSRRHSIDRWPDMDGPYTKDNCRWATLEQQSRNRKNVYLFDIDDERLGWQAATRFLALPKIKTLKRLLSW